MPTFTSAPAPLPRSLTRNPNVMQPFLVRSDRFIWDGRRREFISDHSSIFGPLREGRTFEQVYRDACDVGLTIRSARTGLDVVCAMTDTTRDGEGEVLAWTLTPVDRDLRGAFTVVVRND